MNLRSVSAIAVTAFITGAAGPGSVSAQTAAQQQQMEYERRQREYWREQERQREAERVRQQQMENWRRQDAEMRRDAKALAPRNDSSATSSTGPSSAAGRSAARPTGAADVCKRRPLAKGERNPLLGSWRYRDAPQGDNMSQLFGYLSAPGCALYAMGIAFREGEVQSALSTTPAQYGRADADWWVCLPGTEVEVIRFRVEADGQLFDPDRKCRLVRTDAPASTAAATTAPPGTAATTAAGVLSLAVAAELAGRPQPVADSSFFVLKTSADAALGRAGIPATPGSTRLHAWSKACEVQAPPCQQGMRALIAAAAAVTKTDAGGKAKTPPLPPGTYYVFGVTRSTPTLVWDFKVDVVPGANSVKLDARNAVALN